MNSTYRCIYNCWRYQALEFYLGSIKQYSILNRHIHMKISKLCMCLYINLNILFSIGHIYLKHQPIIIFFRWDTRNEPESPFQICICKWATKYTYIIAHSGRIKLRRVSLFRRWLGLMELLISCWYIVWCKLPYYVQNQRGEINFSTGLRYDQLKQMWFQW